MLWSETVRAPIITALREQADKIATRKADPAYHVTLRHIGSADDPFRHRALSATTANADHLASVRARKALAEAGEPVTEEAVALEKSRDAAWQVELGRLCREWILAGLVDGAAEYVRLWELGGADLLLETVVEIRAFQEPDGPFSRASAPGSGAGNGTTVLPVSATDSSSTTASVAA